MPNPNFTVASEIADLASQGLFPLPYAKQRMKDLGLDEEQTNSLLARAITNASNPHSGAYRTSELEKAVRTLLLAWDNTEPSQRLEAIEPPLTLIRHLIGEKKR